MVNWFYFRVVLGYAAVSATITRNKQIERSTMDELHEEEMICSCGEMHKGHVCWLTNMGLLKEVHHITCDPTVMCKKCGAKANLPHNVCFPTTIAD